MTEMQARLRALATLQPAGRRIVAAVMRTEPTTSESDAIRAKRSRGQILRWKKTKARPKK